MSQKNKTAEKVLCELVNEVCNSLIMGKDYLIIRHKNSTVTLCNVIEEEHKKEIDVIIAKRKNDEKKIQPNRT